MYVFFYSCRNSSTYLRKRKAALRKKLSLHNKENILVSRLFDDQVSLELLLLQIQTALASARSSGGAAAEAAAVAMLAEA